ELANAADVDKKSVSRVFESLQEIIRKQLSSRGPGEFVIPGLGKLRVVKKPATKERQGINPFTKEPITIPAKPASKKVRATALKNLRDLVQCDDAGRSPPAGALSDAKRKEPWSTWTGVLFLV